MNQTDVIGIHLRKNFLMTLVAMLQNNELLSFKLVGTPKISTQQLNHLEREEGGGGGGGV